MRKSLFVMFVPVLAVALGSGVAAPCFRSDSMLVFLDSIPSRSHYQGICLRNDTIFCALQEDSVFYRDRLTGAVIDSFAVQSGGSPIGIVPFGDSLCVSRLGSPEVCEVYTLDGTFIRSFNLPANRWFRGLDWDGTCFWATADDIDDISIFLIAPDGSVKKTLTRSGGFASTAARDMKLDPMFPNRLWTAPGATAPHKLMYVAFDTSAGTFTPLDTFYTGRSWYMSGIGFRNDPVDGGCVYVSCFALGSIWRYRVHEPLGIEHGPDVPNPDCVLYVGPNPANRAVRIECSLPGVMHDATRIALAIYDANGRPVRRLGSDAAGPGIRQTTWNLDDAAGRPVAGGVYFCRLTAGGTTLSQKLIVGR